MTASSTAPNRHHACSACGYNLGPAVRWRRCPECGRTPAERRLRLWRHNRVARRTVWVTLGLGPLVVAAMVATNVVFTHLVYRVPQVDPEWPNWVQTGMYPVLDATSMPTFMLWTLASPLGGVLAARWLWLGWRWLAAIARGRSGTPTHRDDGRWLLIEAAPVALYAAATFVMFGTSTWMCLPD